MDRCSTGIAGLDSMVEGGLPRGSIIGIAGPPGTGKTILCFQHLLAAAKRGEKGYYISLQEPVSALERTYADFPWAKEFADQRRKGRISLKHIAYPELERCLDALVDEVLADGKARHLVVDSISGLIEYMKERDRSVRAVLDPLFVRLRRGDLTVLVVMESHAEKERFGVDKYLVDGVISLELLAWGELERRVFIPKMRWTHQCQTSRRYEINGGGIVVEKGEQA